jgi:DNA-binding NarL/FixJ family response regulator
MTGRKAALSMSPGDRTAVLLDPHPLWLDAVELVLTRNGLTVVGQATDPDRALALVEEFRPSVFVADTAGDGFACIRKACAKVPELKAIVLSSPDDGAQIEAAFAAGAHAYVLKTAHPDDVTVAIRQTFDHSVFLPGPGVAAAPVSTPIAVGSDASDTVASLTKRELEILQLVAEGHSNSQLARILWVTEQTVKFHLSNIYRKLDVANRTEASRWAQVHGLLNPVPPVEVGTSA